jgi:hypothetical protein
MASKEIEDFQEQTLELLRAQQDAYIAAVKAWHEAAVSAAASGQQPPASPTPAPLEALPTPAEMAEATYTFAAKLLADQSRFMQEIVKAMSTPGKKA